MFITVYHLQSMYDQILKIFATIKWPETGWKGPTWPCWNQLWKLERMGQAIETSLLSRPDLIPVHGTIHETFRHLESGNLIKRSHENMRINLRTVRDEITKVLETYEMPVLPPNMTERSDLDHFDRAFAHDYLTY